MAYKKWLESENSLFRFLHARGLSIRQLADRFGVSEKSIHGKRRAFGLSLPRFQGSPTIKPLTPPLPCKIVRIEAPPPRRKAVSVTQFRKPETELDKLIYGRPLAGVTQKIRPENCVSVPFPGDKPDGWKPPIEPIEDYSPISLPRLKFLEKGIPND